MDCHQSCHQSCLQHLYALVIYLVILILFISGKFAHMVRAWFAFDLCFPNDVPYAVAMEHFEGPVDPEDAGPFRWKSMDIWSSKGSPKWGLTVFNMEDAAHLTSFDFIWHHLTILNLLKFHNDVFTCLTIWCWMMLNWAHLTIPINSCSELVTLWPRTQGPEGPVPVWLASENARRGAVLFVKQPFSLGAFQGIGLSVWRCLENFQDLFHPKKKLT